MEPGNMFEAYAERRVRRIFDRKDRNPTRTGEKRTFSRVEAYAAFYEENDCRPEDPLPPWHNKYARAWERKYGPRPKTTKAPKMPEVSVHPSEHLGHWYIPPEECLRLNAVWAHMIKPERPRGTLPIECDMHDKMQYWMECGFPEETFRDSHQFHEKCPCTDCVWAREHPDRGLWWNY